MRTNVRTDGPSTIQMKSLALTPLAASPRAFSLDAEQLQAALQLDDGIPSLSNDVLGFLLPYEWSPLITLSCVLLAAMYLNGLAKGERAGFWRTLAFFLGLSLIYVVTQTHFDYLSQFVFFIHRCQHLILHHLAAMLIALSNPLGVLSKGTPTLLRQNLFEPLWRSAPMQSAYRILQYPLVAGFLFVGLIYFWLIPSVHFNAMLSHFWYEVMNWTMLLDGVLFWWLIFNPYPPGHGRFSLGYGKRCILLALVAFPQIILGAYITLSDGGLYSIYELCGRPWPISAETDQTLGGVITWIPAGMMSALGVVIVLALWSRHERSNARAETDLAAQNKLDNEPNLEVM